MKKKRLNKYIRLQKDFGVKHLKYFGVKSKISIYFRIKLRKMSFYGCSLIGECIYIFKIVSQK